VSIFAIAETEQALSDQLDNPEWIYKDCIEMSEAPVAHSARVWLIRRIA
jgi:hypothetical protein